MEIIDIIEKLNEQLEDKGEIYRRFHYKSYGYFHYIYFGDELLWDNDEREFIGITTIKEDLETYIKKQFNKYVNELNKLKFKIK
jgi:hypothetical protein